MMPIVTGKLILEYEFSDDPHDDFGRLYIWIENESFKLKNSFWVQWQDIIKFAKKLEQPFGEFKKVSEKWGGISEAGISFKPISIEIELILSKRYFDIIVEVNDMDDVSNYGKTHFHALQIDIDKFTKEIELMITKKQKTATLQSTVNY